MWARLRAVVDNGSFETLNPKPLKVLASGILCSGFIVLRRQATEAESCGGVPPTKSLDILFFWNKTDYWAWRLLKWNR